MITGIGIMVLIVVIMIMGRVIGRFISFSGRKAWYLIIGYLILLLLVVPLLYLIPSANPIQDGVDQSDIALRAERSSAAFLDAIQQGQMPPEEHMRELERWSFRFDHPELKIVPNDWQSHVWVLVRRNPSLPEHEIHITYYATPYVLPDYQQDITDLLALPEIIPAREELFITYPKERYYKEYIQFRPESYLNSLTGEEQSYRSYRPIIRGHDLLYLEVPEQLKVQASDSMHLHFIE